MHEPLPHRHKLHRDFETYSKLELPKVGAHRYAQDPSTGVWCMAFAVDDGPVKLWWPGDPVPPEFFEAERNPNWTVVAHNDEFETTIEQRVLGPQHGFPLVPLERHCCTQAMALALALPAKLEMLADALELEHRKDAAGELLMRQMARLDGQYEDPAQLKRLGVYSVQDVMVEREAHDCMAALSPAEQALWVLSCQINARGFHIDRAFAEAAQTIAQAVTPETDAALAEVTGGFVAKATQVDRLKAWLQQQGYKTKKLGRKEIAKLLADPTLTAPARRALELRLSGAQSAVTKLDALFARAGEGDRIRGAFRYCGAGTGRWTASGYQPQNLKKPVVEDLDAAIAAVATGDFRHMKTLYAQPLSVVGDCSRPTIAAAAGFKFIGADLSAVESRVLAWVAGEEWKLEAYRQFDATRDPRHEPYCEIACRIYGVPSGTYTKGSPERDIGKTCDLAFGYMGSVGAWRKFQPDKFTDEEVQKLKNDWRAAHPITVAFWYALERAALRAVRKRGEIISCGDVEFQCSGMFLKLKLPSGRVISYPYPGLVVNKFDKLSVVFRDNAKGQFVDYRGGDGAYGGTWCENLVQGIARDLLAEAMLRLESANYPIVLHVHDEIVAEVPTGCGSEPEFIELMTRVPAWAEGLPIAANAWSGPRYVK